MGDLSGSVNPEQILLDANKTIGAYFATRVNVIAATHGSIRPNRDLLVPFGEEIILTAVPDDGYYLSAWGGQGSGAAVPLSLIVTTPTPNISALFLPLPGNQAALSVYSENPEGGRVAVSSRRLGGAPINTYLKGEPLILTATPNLGWAFAGWTGDATDLANPLFITLDSSKIIAARFEPGSSITIHEMDGGSVVKSPDRVVYTNNTLVALRAVPQPGFTFGGWRGAITSSENLLTLTVTNNLVIYPKFNAPLRDPKWSVILEDWPVEDLNADPAGNIFVLNRRHMFKYSPEGNLLQRWPESDPDLSLYNQKSMLLDARGHMFLILNRGFFDDFEIEIYETPPGQPTVGRGNIRGSVFSFSVNNGGTIYAPHQFENRIGFEYALKTFHKIGSTNWSFVTGETFTRPAIGLDGKIYFTGATPFGRSPERSTNSIYGLAPDGTLLWRFVGEMGVDGGLNKAPVLGVDAVYAIDGTGRLLALNRDGTLRWQFRPTDVLQPPSIGEDGALYLGSMDSPNFYALNTNGTVRWVRRLGRPPYGIPAIGSDGTIYIHDRDSLHAMSANGERLWDADGGGTPIISGNNVIVVSGGNVRVFEANATGAANSSWPMAEGSEMGNGQAQAILARPVIDLAGTGLRAGGFRLAIRGRPGATIRIYYSPDLEQWNLLHTETTATGDLAFLDTQAMADRRFYRVGQ